ncbi:MAG: class I SAM-dependent methyltransferase [Deltaproteobacteria bacterium]|nr:class I SAM-dependent methyltransferase [Deltaproteobacteria bacterium]
MLRLVPDRLKDSWKSVERNEITSLEFQEEQDFLVGQYRKRWTEAILFRDHRDLKSSVLAELAEYLAMDDLNEIRNRCMQALSHVKTEWEAHVDRGDRGSVERFYDESKAMLYELMWWHTLADDTSPLAYVTALEFARQTACRSCLDFGAGVGSGGLLFAANGLDVTLADISSSMLHFCRWRFQARGLGARFLDLKEEGFPREAYDMVAAMDVFEHLVDAEGTARDISRAMKRGGYLFGRFHGEVDEDRPHHIVQDFGPTMNCLKSMGFAEVWRDEWLWGHQVFQKGY